MAIIDPDEVLALGTGTIEAADVIAAAGLQAQRVIDDIAAELPGVIAPEVARTFALIAAELADQGMIAKTRAEDLLGNERPLSGLADLVGADYWTPAPRDPEHPLAHEFAVAEVALPDALLDRYLPVGEADAVGGSIDGGPAVAPARRWSALSPAGHLDPPVSAGWLGARAGERVGGAAARLVTGMDTTVAAAAGGLAGVAAGMTTPKASADIDATSGPTGGPRTDGE